MAQDLLEHWSCATCTPRLKKARGCGTKGEMLTILANEKLDTCPLYYSFSQPKSFGEAVRAYNGLEKGILPEPGAMGDQAAPLVSALSFIGKAVSDLHTFKYPPGGKGKGKDAGAPGAQPNANG